MASHPELFEATDHGLYCPLGDFYIDPWRPVADAVITHAHADHLVSGCERYLCSSSGAYPLRARIGRDAPAETIAFGKKKRAGDVLVSLHPAGHVLGSAQVRVEIAAGASAGYTGVVTGDYTNAAREATNPAEAFESIACDVFISECTFGLPIYRWPHPDEVFEELRAWWCASQEAGRTAMLYTYALGKSQRILAALGARDDLPGPIGIHGSVERLNRAYDDAGACLPATLRATGDDAIALRGRGLVVAPPSAGSNAGWLRQFGPVSSAFASGWARVRGMRRRRALDRGFVLSDHADFPGLIEAVRSSGAERIGLTHGHTEPMARFLRERFSLDTFVVPTRWEGEPGGEEASTEPGPDDEHAAVGE